MAVNNIDKDYYGIQGINKFSIVGIHFAMRGSEASLQVLILLKFLFSWSLILITLGFMCDIYVKLDRTL